MGAIVAGIEYVLGKFVALAKYFGDLVVAVFKAFWDLLTDAFCWVFDQILGVAIVALSAFDFSALSAQVGSWASLPSGLLEVLSAIGLSSAVGLIVSALAIRVLLQLIPFTRLGS